MIRKIIPKSWRGGFLGGQSAAANLFASGTAVVAGQILAWFAILVTGQYPRSLFDFIVGVYRWLLRVGAYAFLLVTDEYPPFSLK